MATADKAVEDEMEVEGDEKDSKEGVKTRSSGGTIGDSDVKPRGGGKGGRSRRQDQKDGQEADEELAQTQRRLLDARIELVHLKTQLEQQKSELTKLQRSHNNKSKVMPTKYCGKTDFLDYLSQFEPIADLHGWTDEEKGVTLLSKFEGEALTIAATVKPKTYENLVAKLTSHFSPDEQETSLQQLQTRKQKKDETYATLAANIEKLAQKAYPQVDEPVQDLIATRNFINAITDASVREKLRERMPQTMEKALKDVRQIAANKEVEEQLMQQQTGRCKNMEEVRRLEEKLEKFEKDLTMMKDVRKDRSKDQSKSKKGPPTCYNCQLPGHIRRWCPFEERKTSVNPTMRRFEGNLPGQTPKM